MGWVVTSLEELVAAAFARPSFCVLAMVSLAGTFGVRVVDADTVARGTSPGPIVVVVGKLGPVLVTAAVRAGRADAIVVERGDETVVVVVHVSTYRCGTP